MLLTLVSRISIIFSFAARTSSGRPATFICGSVKETNYYITVRQYVPPSSCRLRGTDRDRWAALTHRPSHQNRLSSTAAPNWHRVTDYQEAFNILWAPLLRICFSSWVRNTSNSKTMTQTRRSEIRTLGATIVHRWSNRTDGLVRSNSSLFLSKCRQRRMQSKESEAQRANANKA